MGSLAHAPHSRASVLARDGGTRQHGIAWGACAVCVCVHVSRCLRLRSRSSLPPRALSNSCTSVGCSPRWDYRSQTPPSLHRAARRQLRCRRAVSARDPDHRSRHVDRLSCHRSWHVDRRYFKVRELGFEGNLHVEHVNTADNSADILSISDQAAQS